MLVEPKPVNAEGTEIVALSQVYATNGFEGQ